MVVFSAVMCVLGLLLVTALRSGDTLLGSTMGGRQDELIRVVEDLERTKSELSADLAALRAQVMNHESGIAVRQGLVASYNAQLAQLAMNAGVVRVAGKGVRITLADNPHPPEGSVDPAGYVIHDYDLRVVVNALWVGGAEAVAINGQRLTLFSAIRCVGPMVLVNSVRLSSPFVIEAIGDPGSLSRALRENEDARLLVEDYARRFGLRVRIEERGELLLPAYEGRLSPGEMVERVQ